MAASMPAAIVWNASLPEQSVWTGTLASCRSRRRRAAEAPGTIVIGEVVALRDCLTTHDDQWLAVAEEAVCHGLIAR